MFGGAGKHSSRGHQSSRSVRKPIRFQYLHEIQALSGSLDVQLPGRNKQRVFLYVTIVSICGKQMSLEPSLGIYLIWIMKRVSI